MPSCPGSGRAGARARSVPCDGAVSSCCSEITRLSIWGSSRLNLSRENKWKKVVSSKFIVSYAVHTYFEGRVIKKKGAKRRKSDLWAFKKSIDISYDSVFLQLFFPEELLMGELQSRCFLRAVWSAFLIFLSFVMFWAFFTTKV